MKKKMVLLLIILTGLSTFGCHKAIPLNMYSERFDIVKNSEADYLPGIVLEVETSVKDLVIRNHEEEKILIEAHIEGIGKSVEEARENAEKTEIELSEQDNRILISNISPRDAKGTSLALVGYVIYIPEEFNAILSSSTGDILIEKVKGDLNLNNSTGDTIVDACRGDVSFEISTGLLRINSLEGALSGSSSTGDIFLENLKGSVDIETSTGDVRGKLQLSGSTDKISTSTGDVRIELIEPSLEVFFKSNTGKIDLGNLTLESSESDKKSVAGIIGKGEGKLEIVSSTGNIYLESN